MQTIADCTRGTGQRHRGQGNTRARGYTTLECGPGITLPEQFVKQKRPRTCQAGTMQQRVVVMRHGERLDNVDPHWRRHLGPSTPAQAWWDPPLSAKGLQQAWDAGQQLRAQGVPIRRVYSSPFLRCASQPTVVRWWIDGIRTTRLLGWEGLESSFSL